MGFGEDTPQLRRRWIPFRNDASEPAPAFGIMRITGSVLDKGLRLLTVDKPSTTFSRLYVVNGPSDVAAGARGRCTFESPLEVLYDLATPALGEGWGPKPGQWYVVKNYPACLSVYGIADAPSKRLYGRLQEINTVIGKLAGSLSQSNAVTVNIHSGGGGGETVVSSLTLSGQDWLMSSGATAIASGKKVICQWINGLWYVAEAECAG